MTDKCTYCEETKNVEWHHILPRSLGGTDEAFNLIRVCSYHHGLIHGLSSRGNIVELINKGLERTKEKGTILGPPLKLHPDIVVKIVEDRISGVLYKDLEAKYGYPISLINRIFLTWKDDLNGYLELYQKQQTQHLKQSYAVPHDPTTA